MGHDTAIREAPLAAIDTMYPLTQRGADTPGPVDVPSHVSMLTGIRIGLGSLHQDLYVGTTSAIHIFGGGLKGVGYGWFVGPMMAHASAGASSGHVLQSEGMYYNTAIPLNPGGEISLEGFIHGEDPVSAHIIVCLEFDGFPGRIVDSDYREETVGGTANAFTRLGVRGAGVAESDFAPTKKIGEVIAGFIVDPDGHATDSFTIGPVIQLTEGGLLINGSYRYAANWGGIGPDVDVAGGDLLINPVRYEMPGIPINPKGRIRASAANIESASEGHAICGLCYVNG